jgi:hypothetical protein
MGGQGLAHDDAHGFVDTGAELLDQQAKAQKIKNMEKRAKDILVTAGVTFPLNPDNLFDDILAVYGNIETAIGTITNLAEAKTFLLKQAKVLLAWRLLDNLSAYDPKFGEGGE